ncbi:hypothetical protein BDE02_12G065900 [Populus trichocarpa]|jgi:hypothetical protein|nr:hypothetical protein BDE02_12G065900 [Populus trichocarpa]
MPAGNTWKTRNMVIYIRRVLDAFVQVQQILMFNKDCQQAFDTHTGSMRLDGIWLVAWSFPDQDLVEAQYGWQLTWDSGEGRSWCTYQKRRWGLGGWFLYLQW